jgi:hypothetical protein
VTEEKKPIWIPTWLGLLIMVAVLWILVRVMTGGQDLSIDTSASDAAAEQNNKEFAWMERGKDAARAKLKDQDSARFRNVRFHKGKDGVPMTCGEVNSKNSFGGYGGFQKFISAGRAEFTFLSEQMDAAEFTKVWNQFCAG